MKFTLEFTYEMPRNSHMKGSYERRIWKAQMEGTDGRHIWKAHVEDTCGRLKSLKLKKGGILEAVERLKKNKQKK
jgi:hypothetical protein